jgi:hypothetical protein
MTMSDLEVMNLACEAETEFAETSELPVYTIFDSAEDTNSYCAVAEGLASTVECGS